LAHRNPYLAMYTHVLPRAPPHSRAGAGRCCLEGPSPCHADTRHPRCSRPRLHQRTPTTCFAPCCRGDRDVIWMPYRSTSTASLISQRSPSPCQTKLEETISPSCHRPWLSQPRAGAGAQLKLEPASVSLKPMPACTRSRRQQHRRSACSPKAARVPGIQERGTHIIEHHVYCLLSSPYSSLLPAGSQADRVLPPKATQSV
jgi:hypothetical protein